MIPLPEIPPRELRAAARRVHTSHGDSDVQRRALAAYFKARDATQHPTAPPLLLLYCDKRYVALTNGKGPLAVYRIRNDLQLKRLRRIPLPIVAAAYLVALGELELLSAQEEPTSDD
jgi:hypothetical protein